jgi:hypothetical protein
LSIVVSHIPSDGGGSAVYLSSASDAEEENCRSLGYPGFPVESGVFDRMHVVLFEENHMSGRC